MVALGGEGDLDPITPAYTSCSVMSFSWTCTKNFASTVHTQEEKINGDVLLQLDPPLYQPSHPASPLPNTISPHIVPVLTSPSVALLPYLPWWAVGTPVMHATFVLVHATKRHFMATFHHMSPTEHTLLWWHQPIGLDC